MPFEIEPMEQIEKDLQEARRHVADIDRVFLENGDPFCLSADRLDELQTGSFVENTFGEYLDEEEILFSHLDLEGCYYFGLHPSNVVRTHGWLNRDRDRILDEIDRTRERLHARLDQRPVRRGEGAIIF